MKLTFEGTPEECRAEAADFFGFEILDAAPPTPIAEAAKKTRGKATKAPLDTTAAAGAPPPAPPAAAEPTGVTPRTMMPVCTDHAAKLGPNIRPIPAEKSACQMCINDATAAKSPAGKSMTMDEAKAVANSLIAALGGDEGSGAEAVWTILTEMGAESLTGALNQGKATKALDPSQYEEFAKRCMAAMPAPATAPAKRSL